MSLVWRLELTNTSTGLMGECACTEHVSQQQRKARHTAAITGAPSHMAYVLYAGPAQHCENQMRRDIGSLACCESLSAQSWPALERCTGEAS